MTVLQFKSKLELITGYNSGSMKLSIESVKGDKLGEMTDNNRNWSWFFTVVDFLIGFWKTEIRLIGSYQLDDGMTVRVTDPEAIDWNNTDKVEKQDMDDDTYDTFKPTSVKPTVREYKVFY